MENTLTTGAASSRSGMPERSMAMPAFSQRACVATDRRSVATHARWEASGIDIDRSGIPLRELGAPVVSVFSTGVLEAAAAGLPAWVTLADPPPWLREFWERYGLAPWGGAPTASPERPEVEPSRGVAEVVREMMAA